MKTTTPVSVEVTGHIATVTLDRPPVNAVDRSTMAALAAAFESLGSERDIRAAIFTAAGTRAFIAGADLASVGQNGNGSEPSQQLDPGLVARQAMWAIVDCPVPVVGAVNGPAIGAGLAFAACCDILIAAENATFSSPEIDVGLLGTSAHISTLVGRHKAREMFLLGEKISAAELHRLGVIRKVVPHPDLMPSALEVAEQLAGKSPIALRLAKESMNRVEGLPFKEAYRIEQDYTARLLTFEDSAEARLAYLEKRPPVWKWR
jgi:enoyl-CoA hydratase